MINKLIVFGFSLGIPQCPLPAPSVYEWNRECRVWFHNSLVGFQRSKLRTKN
jgi:hypothetical protein